MNGIESQIWALRGTSMHSNPFKLVKNTFGKLFEVPVHYMPFQQSHGHRMVPIIHSCLSQGRKKAAAEARLISLDDLFIS